MARILFRFVVCVLVVLGSKESCENDFKDMFNGEYKRGREMILYSGKDINDLGLYRSCLDLENAKYYLMVSDVQDASITLGLCAPDSCTENDLKGLSHQLSVYYKDSILGEVFKNPEFKESSKFNDREMPPSAFYFIVFLVVFAGIVGISTYLEYLNEKYPNNEQLSGREIFFVFSVIGNYRKFMHVSDHKQDSQVLNGLKVLSMLLICLAHTYVYSGSGPVKNVADSVEKIRTQFKYRPIYSGIYSVDVFFFIGGFLLAFMCMKQMHLNAGKINWVLFFVHRLIRIVPLYYFLNYFYIFLFPYTGFGPAWYLYDHQSKSVCSDYWWSNFIFLNNFLPASEYSCMPWSWYIACDIQFYLISPLLLLLQYHKPLYGYALCSLIILGNFICIVVQGSINDYVPGASGGLMNKEQFTGLYIKPYDRIGAYVLGMMLGYLLQDIERSKKEVKVEKDIELGSINTEETHLKPLINKEKERFGEKVVRLMKVLKYRIGCMICGIVLIVFMIAIPYNYDQHGGDYWPKFLRVTFLAFEHIGFSFGLCMFVMPMLLGFGGWMKQFLSCDFFNIASRLSLGFYMVHPIFVVYITMNTSIGIYFEDVYSLFLLCGVILLSALSSLLLNLTIESPISRLESHLLKHLRS